MNALLLNMQFCHERWVLENEDEKYFKFLSGYCSNNSTNKIFELAEEINEEKHF